MGSNQRAERRRQARESAKQYQAQPHDLPACPVMPLGYEFVPKKNREGEWLECIISTPNYQARFMIGVNDVEQYVGDMLKARQEATGKIETVSEDSQLPSGLVVHRGPVPT